MFYLYILISIKDKKLYIGSTNDLQIRLKKHHAGQVKSTKYRRPLVLAYYEAHRSEADARNREKQLKHYGKAYLQLKRKIQKSINIALNPV